MQREFVYLHDALRFNISSGFDANFVFHFVCFLLILLIYFYYLSKVIHLQIIKLVDVKL